MFINDALVYVLKEAPLRIIFAVNNSFAKVQLKYRKSKDRFFIVGVKKKSPALK